MSVPPGLEENCWLCRFRPAPRLPLDRKHGPAASINPDPAAIPLHPPRVMLATRGVTELAVQADLSPHTGGAVLRFSCPRFTRHGLAAGQLVGATAVAVPAPI